MALNPEPADPVEREEHSLPPKSFADALQEGLDDTTGTASDAESTLVDEDAIKESPPRIQHTRKSSEPRSLVEVMDEGDGFGPLLSSSPSLRHPKGRLEEEGIRDSYAEAVKDNPPKVNGYSWTNGVTHGSGDKTPDTFDGVGEDEEPRSPSFRKTHRRMSSNRSLDSSPATTKEEGSPIFSPKSIGPEIEPAAQGVDGEDKLIYENVTNKSGENLTALKPGSGYFTALDQRANKKSSAEPPPEVDGRLERTSTGTDLVSGRRAGAGWGRSAIRWAPWNVPLQRRLQTLIVLLHTLSIAGLLAIFFFLCMIPLLWPILLPYLIYVLMSRASIDGNLSKRSDWCRQSKIWSLFASYFPARLHRSEKLEPTRKYIFGYHPHGIISHGAFAAFATEALGFSQLFPGITNTLLTLDSNFRIPGYRDYILRMGLASVSRESCENILSKGGPNGEGMGRGITIVVGGARESLDAKPGTLRLVLKRRKGFVKLAIRTGADLVPVLAFGENNLYDQLDTNKHPFIHQLQMAVKKFMGFTVPLFHARGVFNYDVGMMPYRTPINIVIGRPIQIVQSKTPDASYVDQIHEQYVDELVRIWEDWKDTFARHRKGELEIIE